MVNNTSITIQNNGTTTLTFGGVSIPPGASGAVAWAYASTDITFAQALASGSVQILQSAQDTLDNLGFFVQGNLLNNVTSSSPQTVYLFTGAFQTGRLYVKTTGNGVTVAATATPDGVNWYPIPDWTDITLSGAGATSELLPTGVVMVKLVFTPQTTGGVYPTMLASYTLQSYPSAGY